VIDNLETTLRHRLRLCRLLENKLLYSDCEIECQITTSLTATPEEIHLHFAAMKVWLEDFVDNGIAYNPDSSIDTSWLNLLENNIIMIPGEPFDHLMVAVIHSKLNAIGGSVAAVKRTQFLTDTSRGFSNAITGSTDDWLPTMAEWMGDRHFDHKPWWHRADATTIDLQPNTHDDLTDIPDLGGNLVDLLRGDVVLDTVEKNVAEIIKPAFKPRLVVSDDD